MLQEYRQALEDVGFPMTAIDFIAPVLEQYVRDLAAVRKDGRTLQYVREQTPELCMEAVQQDGWALQYVREQTPELCLVAVQKNGYVLQYVREQTPGIRLAALKRLGLAR